MMENYTALKQLACAALLELNSIIQVLAGEAAASPSYPSLSATLLGIAVRLSQVTVSFHQLTEFLDYLEKQTSSTSEIIAASVPYYCLRSIRDGRLDATYMRPIMSPLMTDTFRRKKFFAELNQFYNLCRDPQADDLLAAISSRNEVQDVVSAANNTYSVLESLTHCGCSPQGHSICGSLALMDTPRKRNNHVQFHTVFALTSTNKRQFWAIEAQSDHMSGTDIQASSLLKLTSSDFCKLWRIDPGPLRRVALVQANSIFRHGINERIEFRMRGNEEVVSLIDALSSTLSWHGKLALAQMVATSVYRYYGSSFMRTRWTKSDIHFMPESYCRYDEIEPPYEAGYNPSKPHVTISFSRTNLTKTLDEEVESTNSEYLLNAEDVIHRAPRILALGAILISIMRNSCHATDSEGRNEESDDGEDDHSDAENEREQRNDNWQLHLNEECFQCWKDMEHKDWPFLETLPSFARKKVNRAIESCFDASLYDVEDVAKRRQNLYSFVVQPLEQLKTLISLKAIQPARVEERRRATSKSYASSKWVQNIQYSRLNREIADNQADHRWIHTKIAVLDTGYDMHDKFFIDREDRIKARDFVPSQGRPGSAQDTCGHGSNIITPLMKIALGADFYIARIAKSDDDFNDAEESIVEAIKWAVNECNVDIISMSFGFEQASPAIAKAISEAKDRTLFFAAASNYGANTTVLFPASHESVICIRGTDYQGAFATYNPPATYNEGEIYSTLGSDIESMYHQSFDCVSGTSYATAIAAGIAALILDAAKISLGKEAAEVLKRKDVMEEMFRTKAVGRRTADRVWYINPEQFCKLESHDRRVHLLYAIWPQGGFDWIHC